MACIPLKRPQMYIIAEPPKMYNIRLTPIKALIETSTVYLMVFAEDSCSSEMCGGRDAQRALGTAAHVESEMSFTTTSF